MDLREIVSRLIDIELKHLERHSVALSVGIDLSDFLEGSDILHLIREMTDYHGDIDILKNHICSIGLTDTVNRTITKKDVVDIIFNS